MPTMDGMDVALISPMDTKSAERFTEDFEPLVESSEAILYFLRASFSRREAIGVLRLPNPLAELALRPRVGFPLLGSYQLILGSAHSFCNGFWRFFDSVDGFGF